MRNFRDRRRVVGAVAAGLVLVALFFCADSRDEVQVRAAFLSPQTHYAGVFIPKYVEELPTFAGVRVSDTDITVSYEQFRQKVLPDTFYTGLNSPYGDGTLLWGYKIDGDALGRPVFPGNTIEATRGTPTTVTYVNNIPRNEGLGSNHLQNLLSIDQTIHWANPDEVAGPPSARLELPPYQGEVATVPHLHGGEVQSYVDGVPDQWVTSTGIHGPGYHTEDDGAGDNAAVFTYPNEQEATTLWYHDHALGITRLNVYAGLAAYYFLRDDNDTGDTADWENGRKFPAGQEEFEFVIQDRMFDIVGNLLFPDGLPYFTPNAQHPFWNPEFLGDVVVVNGKSWPVAHVEARRYRLRLLNGSNARFYNLALKPEGKGKGKGKGGANAPKFWVIGTDGGLLDGPVAVDTLLIAPGERYDVIVDFGGSAGQTFTMTNDAKAPFPFGATADPQTVGQIARFVVGAAPAEADASYDPAAGGRLRPTGQDIVRLPGTLGGPAISAANVQRIRQLTLNEIPGPFGPLSALLNNTRWGGYRADGTAVGHQALTLDTGTVAGVTNQLTELPQVGSTEIWEIINLTGDAHPIHLHLVQFQILNRQGFNTKQYEKVYLKAFPGGDAFPAGFFIPEYGPPLDYNTNTNPDPGGIPTIGGNPNINPYLQKSPTPPAAHEQGWKDTVIAYPKQVTRIVVRWAPQDETATTAGTNYYPFDPTDGPGYVWHCHIIDHEDNEMMRPYIPTARSDNKK